MDANDHGMFDKSDDELKSEFWSALKRMHPHLDDEDLVCFLVAKARNVLALSTLNYSESLPPRHTSVPGIHIVNSAMICNGTLNVNETIQLAEQAAEAFQSIEMLNVSAPGESELMMAADTN